MPPKKRNTKRAASPEKRPGGDDDPDLECGICTELLNDARQAPCCGALACCECLDTAARKNRKCPFCRKKLAAGQGLRDVRMERRAANTVRGCPHDGCDFRGKRDKLKAHVEECERRPSEEIIASLREEIATLKREMAKQKKEWRDELADEKRAWQRRELSLTRARDDATATANKYMKAALDAAFNPHDDSDDAAALRALQGYRHAFRFKWSWLDEKTWTTSPFSDGDGGEIKLEVVKANCALSVRLWRVSGDDRYTTHALLLVHPTDIRASERIKVSVSLPKSYMSYPYRLPQSFNEFWGRYVKPDHFVVAVL